MLKAILNGKVAGIEVPTSTEKYWRDTFRATEDFLTASIFERLSYLPGNEFYELLRELAVPRGVLPEGDYRCSHMEFWPHWWFKESRSSGCFKEPDVFLRFEMEHEDPVFIIVEAKLGGGQYKEQWAGEWASMLDRKERIDPDRTYLLAVDGLPFPLSESVGNLQAAANDELVSNYEESGGIRAVGFLWADMLRVASSKCRAMEISCEKKRLFADMVAALEFHGIRTRIWFDEMGTKTRALGNFRVESLQRVLDWRVRKHRHRVFGDLCKCDGRISASSIDTMSDWRKA